MNLSAVRVFVKDVAEAKVFYAERLGLRLTHADLEHGVCILDAGGAQLIVEAVPAGAPADEQVLVGRFTGLSFAVDDIARRHQDLLALGVEFSASLNRSIGDAGLQRSKILQAMDCNSCRPQNPND